MQNDYDEKLSSSAPPRPKPPNRNIVNQTPYEYVAKQNFVSRTHPESTNEFNSMPSNTLKNISIDIPHQILSNPGEHGAIKMESNSNDGVFFATPVNVTDEFSNELVNEDVNEENIARYGVLF